MSLASISFRDLLTQFAANAGRAYDPVQGVDELLSNTGSVNFKLRLASLANNAMDKIWRTPNPAFAWKWTTTSGSITLNADGSIPWSAIQNSDDWFSAWSQDPRPLDNPPNNTGWWVGNSAYPIKCVEDIGFLWPRTTLTALYFFWRMPRPRFNNMVVVGANTYNTGQIVYDETATGHCFMALQNGVLGSALSDATKWAVQAPPDRIGNVIAEFVESMRIASAGSDGSAAMAMKILDQWLEIEMSRELPRDGSGPPWGWDRRYMHQCRYFPGWAY